MEDRRSRELSSRWGFDLPTNASAILSTLSTRTGPAAPPCPIQAAWTGRTLDSIVPLEPAAMTAARVHWARKTARPGLIKATRAGWVVLNSIPVDSDHMARSRPGPPAAERQGVYEARKTPTSWACFRSKACADVGPARCGRGSLDIVVQSAIIRPGRCGNMAIRISTAPGGTATYEHPALEAILNARGHTLFRSTLRWDGVRGFPAARRKFAALGFKVRARMKAIEVKRAAGPRKTASRKEAGQSC